jgi:hypothetical protein
MQHNQHEARDDVDRLFARLQSVAPPPNLKARVLQALPAELPRPQAAPVPVTAPPARAIPWRWIAVGAGVVLLIMSLRLGALLDDSGALSVISEIFSDFGAFLSAPGDYLMPLTEELPWFDIIVTLVALVTFWVSSSASVDQSRATQQRTLAGMKGGRAP